VILNLVSNALKFTHQGTVMVRVGIDPTTHTPTYIDVSDTGIGIPQDTAHNYF
jgi:signal transduction histidine kinase